MTDILPTIPGYKTLKQMGQGGMATVYLAVQESFGRQVALKIMSDQLGQDDIWAKRFMHEARIVSQLSHSNIVPVFDVGNHEGQFYISMELLKGGMLEEKITQGLAPNEIINIVSGVAAGLHYANSKGFIHRDIKPDNIMFRDDGTPVILDFGIAKQEDGDNKLTQTGTIVGTTGYMSPEQAMGEKVDGRADIYSLGIMLYELLTGVVPFRGETAVSVLLKHVQEPPPPLPSNLSAFQAVIDKSLAKKPSDRYANGNEMIAHLQSISLAPTNTPLEATAVLSSISPSQNNDPTIITNTPLPSQNTSKKKRWPLYAAGGFVVVLVALAFTGIPTGDLTEPLTKKDNAPAAEKITPLTIKAVAPILSPAAPKTESSVTPIAVIKQISPEPDPSTKQPEPIPVVKIAPAKVISTAKPKPQSNPSTSTNSVLLTIIKSAQECLEQHQYDCAKSKAETVLTLDPNNLEAKKIHTQSEKAQEDAFSGDWNAQ